MRLLSLVRTTQFCENIDLYSSISRLGHNPSSRWFGNVLDQPDKLFCAIQDSFFVGQQL